MSQQLQNLDGLGFFFFLKKKIEDNCVIFYLMEDMKNSGKLRVRHGGVLKQVHILFIYFKIKMTILSLTY